MTKRWSRASRIGWLALLAACGAAGCAGVQASCNQASGGGGACQEYSGAPSQALDSFMDLCGRAGGTWSSSACTRQGSVGECRRQEVTAVITSVYYAGSVDAQRSACTSGGGTWSGP